MAEKLILEELVFSSIRCILLRLISSVPIFKGLLERGLGITSEGAEQIQAKLSGERLTNEISELLTKLTAQDLPATQASRTRIPMSAFSYDEATLTEQIAKAEESGQSTVMMKKNLINYYCKNQEVDKALEVFKVFFKHIWYALRGYL